MFDKTYSVDNYSLAKCRTRYLWVLDKHCDYSDFDFTWEPSPWEANQIHIWPSQHQENSGTMLFPKNGAEIKNYNHATVMRSSSVPRLHIKHNPTSVDAGDVNTRYISDYLGTMRRVLLKQDWEFCWVTSDICDYTNFDFTWHPSEYQQYMLHVFSSCEQKFGDTFYVHVPTFLRKTERLKILEWYETLNFIDAKIPRDGIEYIFYESDSVVEAVWNHEFVNPIALFSRHKHTDVPTISLWQAQTKTVVPVRNGASSVLIPREVKNYLKTQIYDYPYIDNQFNKKPSQSLDIVFISNGESNAEKNYKHLLDMHEGSNRIVRVDGVNGRAKAYRAALEASNTDWAFCVFAKLEVDKNFNWEWQPDRLQEPKHYIFHAKNPVNDLVYGHMAIIAYNKKLVMKNKAAGLDFTLEQPHEVVPMLSGIARYADDPWIAWRSAFRECLKLKHSLPNVDNNYRLNQWLKADTTSVVASWSAIGAQDAINYYESVEGNFEQLRLTYEWEWLAEYLFKRHNLTPDQLCIQLQGQLIQDI